MGLFSKPEVVVLKESSDAGSYLEQLEKLYEKASGIIKENIDKEIKFAKAGIAGENAILYELKNSGMDMFVLHDIMIEVGDQSAQIDYYVITPKVHFIIECKNLFGNIEINNKGEFIRTFDFNGRKLKEGIYSPITQNERHMQVLKTMKSEEAGFIGRLFVKGLFDSCHRSLVVLANPKTVLNCKYAKKEVKEKVIRADQLITTIKEICSASKNPSSSRKEMREEAESILSRNVETRKDYVEKYRIMMEEVEKSRDDVVEVVSEKNEELCPHCGKKLVERNGKFGAFVGCSGYPMCRYTKKL